MADLAHLQSARRAVADTPARRALRFVLQPAVLGLLLALLVTALLGDWFYRQAAGGLAEGGQSRAAILEGSALSEFVAARLAASPDDDAADSIRPAAAVSPIHPTPAHPSPSRRSG